MDYRNIIQHRVEAEKCFRRSRGTTDPVEKLLWLKQADVCLLLANQLARHEASETGTNATSRDPHKSDQQDTWH